MKISLLKRIIGGYDSTPILSTSILSRPRGPRELLMMFAMDCAAITKKDVGNQTEKWNKKTNHFGL